MKTAPTFDQLRAREGLIHIHGHRGARGVLPENTLESFRFTFDVGVRIVELDVLMTADDVPVITHNPRLLKEMTRDQNGNWLDYEPWIRELSLAELQRYDVGGLKPGSDYAKRFPDQAFIDGWKIPTLEALCELINAPQYLDVCLNLEIKSNPHLPDATPKPAAYMAKVLEVIQKHNLQERMILQSFDWRVVHESARQAPKIPRSYLCYSPIAGGDPMEVNVSVDSPWMDGFALANHDNSLPKLVAAAGGQVWAPYHNDLTAETMAEARECGLMVNVWTVNEPAEIDRVIELGVDGIITDYPGRVQRRLLDHGLSWK